MNPDEQKIIELYKQTRRQQPTQQLDDKILLAAKTRLAQKPKNTQRVIWALSSVAVIVLSVNVALKLVITPEQNQVPLAPLINTQEDSYEAFDSALAKPQASTPLAKKSMPYKEASKALKKRKLKAELTRQKKQTLKQRAMMPRMMQAPMPQELTASDIMADENISHQLPYFPFNVKQLAEKYSLVSIQKTSPNNIQIIKANALILSLSRLNQQIIISAYPNSESLGIRIDWTLKPSQLNKCIMIESKKQCSLNSTQTAHFKNAQLIKVTWVQ